VPALIGLSPENQRLVDVRMDQRVLMFVILIAALTSILFGLMPAIKISGPTRFARRHRPRNALIVTEIALAVMLLAGTSLLVKSYLRVQDVSPGIRTQNVLTVEMSIPRETYPSNADVSRFYNRVLTAVNGLPGIDSAATVRTLPFGGRSNFAQFDVRGAPARDSNDQDVLANQQIVSANYFTTAGVKLLAGRFLTDQDGEGAPAVAIINDALARRVWKNEPPVGAQIRIGPPEWGLPWLTIVGVTSNVMHYGLDQKIPLEIYVPFDQVPVRDMAIFLTTRIDPSLLVANVRQKIYEADPDQAASAVRSMEQVIDDSLWQRKVLLWIMLLFAGVALTLSSMAIYGVIAFSVQQRQSEFGIRIALGAQRTHILRIAVGEGMRLVLIGICIGLLGSTAAMSGITKLLYDVQATDPAAFLTIAILLAAAAFIAAYIPARRAATADPMSVLRVD
jgi:putative ABC transport system permease protein